MNMYITDISTEVLEKAALENFEEQYLVLSDSLLSLSYISIEHSLLDKLKELVKAIYKWIKSFFSKSKSKKQEEVFMAASQDISKNESLYREFFSASKEWLASPDGLPDRILILLGMMRNGSFSVVLNYVINTVGSIAGDLIEVGGYKYEINNLKHTMLTDRQRLANSLVGDSDRLLSDLQFILDNQKSIIVQCNVMLDAAQKMLDESIMDRPSNETSARLSYASALISISKEVLVITASNTDDVKLMFKRIDEKMNKDGLNK